MKLMKKVVLAVAAVAASLPALATELVVGAQSGPTYLPLVLAERFYAENGGEGSLKIVVSKTDELMKLLAAGDIQMASIGGPSAIRMYDQTNGRIRILDGLSRGNSYLYCRKDSGIESLKDIKPEHVISIVGDDAVQTWSVKMSAFEQLGNAKALDRNFRKMSHPDAMKSMTAQGNLRQPNDPVCAATSAPYSDMYRADGRFSQIFDSAMLQPDGKYGFRIGDKPSFVVQTFDSEFCAKNKTNMGNCVAMYKSVRNALEWLGQGANHAEAAKVLMSHAIGKGLDDKSALEAVRSLASANAGDSCTVGLTNCHTIFGSNVTSIGQYANFMFREGAIKHIPVLGEIMPFNNIGDPQLPSSEAARDRIEKRIAGRAVVATSKKPRA